MYLGPICGREPFVGRLLGKRGRGFLGELQGFADRGGHGDVDVIARVVLFYGKPVVLAARWVDGDEVILPERVKEMGGVVGDEELDTKVIYGKGEGGRQGCMGSKTGGVRHRSVAMGLEVAEKELVGNNAGFP